REGRGGHLLRLDHGDAGGGGEGGVAGDHPAARGIVVGADGGAARGGHRPRKHTPVDPPEMMALISFRSADAALPRRDILLRFSAVRTMRYVSQFAWGIDVSRVW